MDTKEERSGEGAAGKGRGRGRWTVEPLDVHLIKKYNNKRKEVLTCILKYTV